MAKRSSKSTDPAPQAWLLAALEFGLGPALVLSADLHIVAATLGAAELLGEEVPLGTSAIRFLCGNSVDRPIAIALAEGRPVRGAVTRVKGKAEVLIGVRATPFAATGKTGWLLLLDLASVADQAPTLFCGMWTNDPRMLAMFRILERAAKRDVSVLVRGETGAGKELVARAVHDLSHRAKRPFYAVNCAALPANLLESELFGHVRGAFTGAVRDQAGYFQTADSGTLFLDEVAEMPLELQAKLLRVLETKTVIPVGGREPVQVDVRIVTATHRSLRRAVLEGRFRADLMYRLRVVPLFLPPLRARPNDLALLLDKFMTKLNQQGGRRIEQISPSAWVALERHSFPGNVRELKNVLEYAYVVGDGPVLLESDLPPELVDPNFFGEEAAAAGFTSTEIPHDSPEVARIRAALERAGGSRERASKMLGTSRVTLWRRMKQLGIEG